MNLGFLNWDDFLFFYPLLDEFLSMGLVVQGSTRHL
jgi:hypothetical protein